MGILTHTGPFSVGNELIILLLFSISYHFILQNATKISAIMKHWGYAKSLINVWKINQRGKITPLAVFLYFFSIPAVKQRTFYFAFSAKHPDPTGTTAVHVPFC